MAKISIARATLNTAVLTVLFISVALFAFVGSTHALTVSPVRIELDGDPGSTISRTIKLTNEQDEEKTFYVSYENFTAKGETGKPEFTGGDNDLATWISAPSEVTLQAGEERKITININVPADADPGGHFAAIFWGTSAPDTISAGEVAIGGRLGILILLRVNGDVDERASLLDFGGLEDDKTVFQSLPITFSYRLKNDGNVRVRPEGAVAVTNVFGNEVVSLDANKALSNALPSSTRRFDVVWGEELIEEDLTATVESSKSFWEEVQYQASNFNVGRYEAALDIEYGEKKTRASDTFTFWILPWQLLSVVGGTLVVGLLLIIFVVRLYTRWLVRRALESQK